MAPLAELVPPRTSVEHQMGVTFSSMDLPLRRASIIMHKWHGDQGQGQGQGHGYRDGDSTQPTGPGRRPSIRADDKYQRFLGPSPSTVVTSLVETGTPFPVHSIPCRVPRRRPRSTMRLPSLTLLAVWAAGAACNKAFANLPNFKVMDELKLLMPKLSPKAFLYLPLPGSAGFPLATRRWSALESPHVNVVIVPATENDVVEIVKSANKVNVPFLVYNGAHGSITTLGKMRHGIEIWMRRMSGVEISEDGKTATIAGGTLSKTVTDELWAKGKQTVTGTCECVSVMGPALGGGHGWLQGRHGLVADQFLSMNVVLANGTRRTIDRDDELWWAMQGAGHNFGVVTSVTTKIYDVERPDWAIETFIFTGDKVEAVYRAANDHLLKNGTQPVDLINWSYWLSIPGIDAGKPVIIFYVIQEGVTSVDAAYTKPFHDIGPFSVEAKAGDYRDLAGWTGISLESPPCKAGGSANPRFPIYLDSYNVEVQRKIYDKYAAALHDTKEFAHSIFMFEGYSTQGVKAIDEKSTAFPYRSDNLLVAPLISYPPAGADLDAKARRLGEELREMLREGSGRKDLRAYINYAHGSETTQQWYGNEDWRQKELRRLKDRYDPKRRFSFYAPIA
ncbi:FAD binding domain protein [Drechmeria coniospora]|uniref:FAD binding domain protein n=1 Tax=Drechmeria coniospora TaxID=98403 RepID=A0A151GV31_DRECN|nr:FAD binding domain protein [Drechmeria coniospora]KYK60923.1 FAD binding domain protein [Drechmeria coniospora]ODA83612.1 hypothetical protein RJ55_02127 [Drechmeria coniospora]